jgi:hypothetical protein
VSAGRILIVAGAVILGIGVLVQLGLPLGRLPGDIRFGGGGFTVYAPLATGLLISVALTIIINLLLRG